MSYSCKYCGETIMEDDIDYCCQCGKAGTGTKPEPEQDERIHDIFVDHIKDINDFSLFPEWWEGKESKKFVSFLKSFIKSGYTSRNAEIKAMKYQLDGFKDQYNINGKLTEEIEALKAEIESMREDFEEIAGSLYADCSGDDGHAEAREIIAKWTRKTK